MTAYKTYKKQKYTYLVLSVIAFFAPLVTAIGVFFPSFEYSTGAKAAIGCIIILLHTSVFAAGIWNNIRIHYPMLSPLPLLFCLLYGFFTLDFFEKFVIPLAIIELIALFGEILSAIFWIKFRKYSRYSDSVKAISQSGMLDLKSDKGAAK